MSNSAFKVGGGKNKINEGAGRGRRLGSWGTRPSSPDQEVVGDLDVLRERSRTLRRDNAWSGRGAKVDASMIIGTGIKPVPMTSDEKFNKHVSTVLDDWVDTVDFIGTNESLYGIQKQMRVAKRESGECFLVFKRMRIDRNKQPVPLQLQLLESEYCPLGLTINMNNGHAIKNGIELNSRGQIVAYYFHKEHPSERNVYKAPSVATQYGDLLRIPKNDVVHYYDKERPNQLRGRPVTSNSIITAKTYDSYTDAELVRKESRSALTGTIERESYTDADYRYDPMSGQPLDVDDTDTPMVNLEAGTFQALLAGESLNLIDADDTGVGYRDYQVFQLMQIAASHGVPYQLLTGDWAGINDRVWRAIFTQYKREARQDQELGLMPQVCTPIYHAFLERGIVANVFNVNSFKNRFDYLRVSHKTQAHEYIHPEQDIKAAILKMKAGLTSRTAIIATNGDHGETIESIDNDRSSDKIREEGLDLKSTANYDTLDDPQLVNEDGSNGGDNGNNGTKKEPPTKGNK